MEVSDVIQIVAWVNTITPIASAGIHRGFKLKMGSVNCLHGGGICCQSPFYDPVVRDSISVVPYVPGSTTPHA